MCHLMQVERSFDHTSSRDGGSGSWMVSVPTSRLDRSTVLTSGSVSMLALASPLEMPFVSGDSFDLEELAVGFGGDEGAMAVDLSHTMLCDGSGRQDT